MPTFHNINPRSRAERRAVCDKESWEKERLKQRKEGFVRIDPNVSGHAMTEYDTRAQGFCSDADRFHTDTAGEQKRHRDQELLRQRLMADRKRTDNMQREEQRWNKIETELEQDTAKWNEHRENGKKAFRNKGSEPYNLLTLTYNQDAAGSALRQSDDHIKYRATMRAQNMRNNNCRSGINPITGEPL